MSKKRLYFARHGEGTNNVRGVWESNSPSPLTRLGRKQAKAEGKKAKKLGYKFDHVIASPAMRTRQTAEIIAKRVGYPIENIEINDLFVERYYGDLENQPVGKFKKGYNFRNMDEVPNIETLEMMHHRAKKAHDYLLSLPHNDILVVSHSGFGRALMRVIKNQPHTHEHVEYTPLPHAEIILWVEDEA